jgi:UDP-N-acetylglucosamine--N-acetylmuramyl-(pentapeptide) pyrophosphoryl-undecaprenol N-acetylglucosamine transferase
MAAAYYEADLVVCRAGAMTVAEICAAGLAAVLVPYPYAAGNHQKLNAQYLVSQGAAIALEESNLSANLLALTVKKFQDDRARLLSIAQKARALGRPDAIGRVTAQCLEVVSA